MRKCCKKVRASFFKHSINCLSGTIALTDINLNVGDTRICTRKTEHIEEEIRPQHPPVFGCETLRRNLMSPCRRTEDQGRHHGTQLFTMNEDEALEPFSQLGERCSANVLFSHGNPLPRILERKPPLVKKATPRSPLHSHAYVRSSPNHPR